MANHDSPTIATIDAVTARVLGEPLSPDALGQLAKPPDHIHMQQELRRAEAHVNLGAHLAPTTRFRHVKKLVLRMASLFTREQHTYNVATLEVLRGLEAEVQLLRAELDRRLACVHAGIATTEVAVQSGSEALSRLESSLMAEVEDSRRATRELRAGAISTLEADLLETNARLASLARQRSDDRTALRVAEARLEAMLRELRTRFTRPGVLPETAAGGAALGRLAEDAITSAEMVLYAAFENVFRGTPAEVKAMLSPYLDEVATAAGPGAPVLDIGFGRGDWLALLVERDVPAYGIDTNIAFVEAAGAVGIDGRLGEAVEHLQGLPEASLGAVTAFHVAEHLPFEVLTGLLGSALRALKPGGLLILETPNPSNLRVGASNFYLDPTHRRPLPSDLLRFLVERAGFVDIEVRLLHPAHASGFVVPRGGDGALVPLRQMADELNVSLFGPQDYSVVARRAGG